MDALDAMRKAHSEAQSMARRRTAMRMGHPAQQVAPLRAKRIRCNAAAGSEPTVGSAAEELRQLEAERLTLEQRIAELRGREDALRGMLV